MLVKARDFLSISTYSINLYLKGTLLKGVVSFDTDTAEVTSLVFDENSRVVTDSTTGEFITETNTYDVNDLEIRIPLKCLY